MAFQRLLTRGSGAKALALVPNSSRIGVRHSSTGPATVADASFWRSLVPKPLRRENRAAWSLRNRQWNPATFFIVMFLFIGSMSIQMIALRNSFNRYMRQSTARIGKLREVVEKIQNGEQVDVEKILGTGDPKQEADWEESRCFLPWYLRAFADDSSAPTDRARRNGTESPEGKVEAITTPTQSREHGTYRGSASGNRIDTFEDKHRQLWKFLLIRSILLRGYNIVFRRACP